MKLFGSTSNKNKPARGQDGRPAEETRRPDATPAQPEAAREASTARRDTRAREASPPRQEPGNGVRRAQAGAPSGTEKAPQKGKTPKPKKEKAPGTRQAAGEKKGPGKGRIALVAALCVVLLLCAVTALGAALVSRSQSIYPGVELGGVKLGGMTVEEATAALSAANYGIPEDEAVRVELPAGVELSVTAKEAGFATTPAEGAQMAWRYGRETAGNPLSRLFAYLGSALTGTNLDEAEVILDESGIRAKIAEAAAASQEALMGEEVEISDTDITVLKGANLVSLDEDAIYDLVEQSLRARSFGTLAYTPQYTGTAGEFDFQALYDEIYTEPKDAQYDSETDSVTESQTGRSFDIQEAQRLWDEAAMGDAVVIPLEIQEPEITAEELRAVIFADCLSQKTTSLSGSTAARINNITKACAAINGLVLNPGEEFSYNGALGQRTAAAGYQAAGAYSNGQVVSEVGGGICQVSSTLYYCTLYANLEIVERYCHYFGVNYLPAGLDATVSWPNPDFKFKNDRDYPIKIEAYVQNGQVTVKIWGTDVDGSYVEMQVESWSTSNGYGTQSYRLIYDKDGNLLEKREEAASQYHYHGTTTETTTPATPTPTPTPSTEVTPPPATDPVVTPPPATDPVVTPPPATDPVVTPPPATDPVVTPPPATDPVATPPPAEVPAA